MAEIKSGTVMIQDAVTTIYDTVSDLMSYTESIETALNATINRIDRNELYRKRYAWRHPRRRR